MNHTYIQEYNTKYQNMDYTGNLKLSALLNDFSDLATTHAMMIGSWDPKWMSKYGWILSKIHLERKQYTTFDQYSIVTSLGKASKVIFPRYFDLQVNGQSEIVCSTLWSLLDLESRKIVIPSRIGLTGLDSYIENPPCQKPGTIEVVDYELVSERKVLYSDLDTNGHMNNTKYLDWACDLLDYSIYKNNYIQTMDIYFMHEIGPNEIVQLYLCKQDQTYFIKGAVKETDCFKIKLHFEKKD